MTTKFENSQELWQNTNGTFSHHHDSQREWADLVGCQTDLRFHREWAKSGSRPVRTYADRHREQKAAGFTPGVGKIGPSVHGKKERAR